MANRVACQKEAQTMFRKLVVPLDVSALAERALPYAVRLARAEHGRLILMKAALASPPARLDGADWEASQLDAVRDAEAYLQGVAYTIEGLPVQIAVPYGRAADTILKTVLEVEADAVVMATHGRTGPAHLLYGSVTEAVLSRSSVPVLVVQVRPGEAPEVPFEPAAARLLVPLDGSSFDEPALRAAVQALGAWGEITLVSVVEPAHHVERDEYGRVIAYLDQQEEARTREARDYLSTIAQDLRQQVPPIRTNVDVRIGDPAQGIAMAALAAGADLIVMATHGRTGIRRALMGSVAGAVLQAGSTPVLLIHPQPAHQPVPRAKAAIGA